MEKVQQDNDPNWYSKQPKCNSTHNFLLSTQYSSHGNTDCQRGPYDCNMLAIQVPECMPRESKGRAVACGNTLKKVSQEFWRLVWMSVSYLTSASYLRIVPADT
jgi:hypothetical protein